MLPIAALLATFAFALPAAAQQSSPAAPPVKPAAKKSSMPKGAAAPPTARGPCVGVISPAGDVFSVKKIGFTVFGNEYKELAADDFKLHDIVIARVQAALGRGFAVRKIAYPKGVFDKYHAGGFGLGNADAAALVQKVVGTAGCERYVVLTRGISQFIGNQSLAGVGAVNFGSVIPNQTEVHAIVRINVHDGRTFEHLKGGQINAGRRLPGFTWPERPEAMNTPQSARSRRPRLPKVWRRSCPSCLRGRPNTSG